jgi:hypothetical protein
MLNELHNLRQLLRGSSVALVIALALFALLAGCDPRDPAGPVGPSSVTKPSPLHLLSAQNMVCNTTSGVLTPTAPLFLTTATSGVTYTLGSVLAPTAVSFSICDWDSTGTNLRPKAQVFGPVSIFEFLQWQVVTLSLQDAGMASNTPTGTPFKVYRQNELTGVWEYQQSGAVILGSASYGITKNGTYAITTDTAFVLDSSWTSSALVTPLKGGSFSILHSSFSVPAGALHDTTVVSLTMTIALPEGLPNALPRVYEFGPEGTQFTSPATFSVAFEDIGNASADVYPGLIVFKYFDKKTKTWVPQPTQVDWTNQRFIVQLTHFSRYAFCW